MLDEPVYMHCKVQRQGDYDVAWIRERDQQLLTVGKTTFTKDSRFYISYREPDNDYLLVIKLAKKNDSGVYECQLSTEPPQSFHVTLTVLEPPENMKRKPVTSPIEHEARLGTGTNKVELGEKITLSCEITRNSLSEQLPDQIDWTLNATYIDVYDKKKYRTSTFEDGLRRTYRLEVLNAGDSDAGTYTCKPQHAPEQSMLIQVNRGWRSSGWTLLVFVALLFLLRS